MSLLTAKSVLQLKLMTSWAVVCDVYFLEPQTKHKDESSQQFAERVQKLIANRAKLHIAPWDGYLKYYNLGDKVWLQWLVNHACRFCSCEINIQISIHVRVQSYRVCNLVAASRLD